MTDTRFRKPHIPSSSRPQELAIVARCDVATPEPTTAVPATAAPAAAPAPCDEYTAPYRVDRQVVIDGMPAGRVIGWSCESAADAEAQADEREGVLRESRR